MILHSIQIINYKSCRNIYLELEKDNPNILIGINDCGKSTILSAIGLLFETTRFNFDQDDKAKKDLANSPIELAEFEQTLEKLNVPSLEYSASSCYILGEFIIEEDDDLTEVSTHLQWVLDSHDVERINICRIFNNVDKTSQHYICTPIGTDDTREYFREKATALGKIAKEKKIDKIENENNVGRFTSLELLRGIMNTLQIQTSWSVYKFDKNAFPQYRYLDWNISMDQLTQFTKDTMTEQVKDELVEAQKFANDKRITAQDKINIELDSFTANFLKEIPTIEKLKANIYFDVQPRFTDLLINKKNSVGDIHIDSQGDGVKRQIWFSLIKWNALNAINLDHKNKKFIWCFDEPETHLYPAAQREFYKTIKQTTEANVQTLISTHSTIFVDKTLIKSINKVDLQDGVTAITKCSSVDDIYESLKLRNSDFLFYDKFIVVEGDTEEALLPHFFKLATGSLIEDESIKIINLGGKDKLEQNAAVLDGVLGEFKKSENSIFYILDNDARFKLSQHQIEKYNPTFVGKQDIEDSISTIVWMNIIKSRLEPELQLKEEEIEAIKFNIKSDSEEESKKKFYPILMAKITRKLIDTGRDDYYTVAEALPSKGSDSAKILIDNINSADLLPQNLVKKLEEIKASS